MMKKIATYFLISLTLVSIATPVAVWAMTKTEALYMIEEGERVDGNIIAAANSVEIRGRVNGDVVVAGEKIIIAGDIEGDVFAAGSNIRVEGYVKGSVWAAGKNVSIASNISHNVWLAGQQVTITNNTVVGWDAYTAGSIIATEGVISRTLWAAGNTITIGSRIGNDVRAAIDQTGTITVLPTAAIARDFGYKAPRAEQLTIQDGGKIFGSVKHQAIAVSNQDWRQAFNITYLFGRLLKTLWWIVIGIVLVTVVPKKVKEVVETMMGTPSPALLRGLGVLFLAPIVAVIMAITFLGIPLAVLMMLWYVIVLCIATVLGRVCIGQWVLRRLKLKQGDSLMWSLVVGSFAVALIGSLPFIGGIGTFVLAVWALGALVAVQWRTIQEWR
jgi:cytoskeletal protein CcmA (bactofilin family)